MSDFPKIPFSVDFEDHLIKGDKTHHNEKTSVLFLHGAGTSTRKRVDPLRLELFKHNMPSVAFDFIGHGETGGCLNLSSLQNRFDQACTIIEALNISTPMSLIASSMSGYTAIKLLEKYEIKDLILIVPAVYHADANSIPFDQGFSEIIRKPQSWLHSDAWEILQQFTGNLLIIAAENDEVISPKIIDAIYKAASSAKRREVHIVEGSSHTILAFLAHNPDKFKQVAHLFIDFLK